MGTLELIETIVLVVVILALSIFYIVKAIKNNWIGEISNTMYEAIKEAEASGKSGQEKLNYVLEKVQKCCEEKGIPFAIIKALVIKAINKVIADYNVIVK